MWRRESKYFALSAHEQYYERIRDVVNMFSQSEIEGGATRLLIVLLSAPEIKVCNVWMFWKFLDVLTYNLKVGIWQDGSFDWYSCTAKPIVQVTTFLAFNRMKITPIFEVYKMANTGSDLLSISILLFSLKTKLMLCYFML